MTANGDLCYVSTTILTLFSHTRQLPRLPAWPIVYQFYMGVDPPLFLVLEDRVQAPHMRRKLHSKLVSFVEVSRRLFAKPDTGRRARDDDRSRWQSGALREETHELSAAEDHVTDRITN